jgi:hypothetical protein
VQACPWRSATAEACGSNWWGRKKLEAEATATESEIVPPCLNGWRAAAAAAKCEVVTPQLRVAIGRAPPSLHLAACWRSAFGGFL